MSVQAMQGGGGQCHSFPGRSCCNKGKLEDAVHLYGDSWPSAVNVPPRVQQRWATVTEQQICTYL